MPVMLKDKKHSTIQEMAAMHRVHIAMMRSILTALVVCSLAILRIPAASAQRVTIPLDGSWAIADSVDGNAPPSAFDHAVSVPGLVHSAKPAFADVDRYQTQEFIGTMIGKNVLPPSEAIETPGKTPQTRMFFWY